MANLNRIILVGQPTADPEIRNTVEGLSIAKFTLAIERYRGPNNPKETDLINIVAWRNLADICGQLLKKGKLVLVEGRIQVRTYQTDAGAKRWVTEVVARNIQMLNASEGVTSETKIQEPSVNMAGVSGDIPGSSSVQEDPNGSFQDSDLPF